MAEASREGRLGASQDPGPAPGLRQEMHAAMEVRWAAPTPCAPSRAAAPSSSGLRGRPDPGGARGGTRRHPKSEPSAGGWSSGWAAAPDWLQPGRAPWRRAPPPVPPAPPCCSWPRAAVGPQPPQVPAGARRSAWRRPRTRALGTRLVTARSGRVPSALLRERTPLQGRPAANLPPGRRGNRATSADTYARGADGPHLLLSPPPPPHPDLLPGRRRRRRRRWRSWCTRRRAWTTTCGPPRGASTWRTWASWSWWWTRGRWLSRAWARSCRGTPQHSCSQNTVSSVWLLVALVARGIFGDIYPAPPPPACLTGRVPAQNATMGRACTVAGSHPTERQQVNTKPSATRLRR